MLLHNQNNNHTIQNSNHMQLILNNNSMLTSPNNSHTPNKAADSTNLSSLGLKSNSYSKDHMLRHLSLNHVETKLTMNLLTPTDLMIRICDNKMIKINGVKSKINQRNSVISPTVFSLNQLRRHSKDNLPIHLHSIGQPMTIIAMLVIGNRWKNNNTNQIILTSSLNS